MDTPNTIKIDDIEYVRADSLPGKLCDDNYVIIRSRDSGVHAGYLAADNEAGRVKLTNARRIWYWDGAASLSELAAKGPSNPENCKVPCPVAEIIVLGVCEIISCTEDAKSKIQEVPVWTQS